MGMPISSFKPEKYGMVFCIECHGNGKSEGGKSPCQKCGGFGFLIRNINPWPTIRMGDSVRLKRDGRHSNWDAKS
jgi:DnaJ-class molecular chaperone